MTFSGVSTKWKACPAYTPSGADWLGQIPAHWSIYKLKFLATVSASNVDKKWVEGERSVRLCNYVDVYHHDHITEDIEFLPATASAEQVERFSLRRGDVIITKDSESWTDIAVAAFVPKELEGVVCGYHLALVQPAPELVDGAYLFRAFAASAIRDQFHVAANGITRYGLSKDAIDGAMFPVPPVSEQRAIAAFLDRETAKIDALVARKERLIELLQEKRAALITHAVTKGVNPSAPMKDSGVEWLGQVPTAWNIRRNKLLFREHDNRSIGGEEELLTVSHITGVTPRSEKEVYMFEAE